MVVLVVEDEAIIAYCSAAMLEDAGYAVLGPAHTSAEALELARSKRPDVALIDIDLEVPGGYQRRASAAHPLRNRDCLHDGSFEQAQLNSDIAVAALAKPFDPADLPRIVAYAASRPRHFSRSSATPSRSASFTGFPLHNGSGA